jgi:cytochrome P450
LQAAWLAYRPFRFLEWCRNNYGDVFTITTPPLGPTPVFSRPDDFQQILALDSEVFLDGAAQAPVVDFAGDRSLMKLDGRMHQEHQEILTRSLKPSSLPAGGMTLLHQIRESVARWPVGKRFDLGAATDRLALDLVESLVFDQVPAVLKIRATRAMHLLRRASHPLWLLLYALLPSQRVPFSSVRSAAESYIAERTGKQNHEESLGGSCLFERLAAQSSSTGTRLGFDDLRDELMTVLTALLGGLTCGTKHAFYWVLRTPGTQQRIRDELSGTASTETCEQITSRPYLDAVCKEVLRLCPDIPFAVRRTSTDVEVRRWRLPAGTTIGLCIYLLHRTEASFPEADRFIPDRFLGTRPARFEYLPFGGGRRGCVAGPLFMFLEKLILASALDRFHIYLCDPRENPVTSMALVSTPARPLWAIAQRVYPRRLSTGEGTCHRADTTHAETRGVPSQHGLTDVPFVPQRRSSSYLAPENAHECPARGARQRG